MEFEHRRPLGYPPFGRLARIIFRGVVREVVEQFAESVVSSLRVESQRNGGTVRVLGPALPPIPKLRGQYRYHAMLACPDAVALHVVLAAVQSKVKPPEDTLYLIDIDPIDML